MLHQAIARKGIGKDHAKWIPVATAAMQYMPEVIINEALASELSEQQCEAFVRSCPTPVFKYNRVTRRVRTPAALVDVDVVPYGCLSLSPYVCLWNTASRVPLLRHR